ncbi:EamA family transporter RarD [Clostridium cylindrosporum]|uniref:Protein RarD n=1 Tax=Clostridium cylindrosporum DSM 605 TaxID=1121307 RepID=A0A0J8DG95_CLOCY|nr:EamA family transporter RarD [Clostridium cylindrosporum]KMT23259.1 protein RarD [Clostridium cylindrosporum DSM 605]
MISRTKMGVIYATLSYLLWGILPLYWKAINNVAPFEILANRIFWAFIFVGILLMRNGQLKELIEVIKNKRSLLFISLSAAMVTVNWGLYIWAVNSNHIVESSLGYYMNPLIVVFFGVIFLKEKLTKGQIAALILATTGVLVLTFQYGKVPWISIALAVTFALYGLLKKLTNAGSMVSLGIETALVTPFALIYIITRQINGIGAFGNITAFQTILLVCSGIVTATPLILFAKGAKRIPLSTLGFIQYISPTMSLLLGIFLFHEKFTIVHLISFGFIWLSLLVYSISETKFVKKEKKGDIVS